MQIPTDLGDKRNGYRSFFLIVVEGIVGAGMTELSPGKETICVRKGHVLLTFYGPVHFVHMTIVVVVVVITVSPQETAIILIAVPVIHETHVVGLFRHKDELK